VVAASPSLEELRSVRRPAGLLAGLLLSLACATPAARWTPIPPDDPRPARLLAEWSEAAEARRGLRGRARLSVDAGDGEVRLRGRQLIALERPARMRVEIQGLLSQTVAVLVTDGTRYEVFRAQDRSYQSGPVHPGLLREQAYLDLTPEEAIGLLLGVPVPGAGLTLDGAATDPEAALRIDLADAGGALRQRARFDAEGLLREVEVFDAEGDLVWSALFDGYAPVGDVPFAHAVTLEVASGATRAEISLRDVQLNPALSPDIFRLRAPQPPAAGAESGG
jgi:hypothetical protein